MTQLLSRITKILGVILIIVGIIIVFTVKKEGTSTVSLIWGGMGAILILAEVIVNKFGSKKEPEEKPD